MKKILLATLSLMISANVFAFQILSEQTTVPKGLNAVIKKGNFVTGKIPPYGFMRQDELSVKAKAYEGSGLLNSDFMAHSDHGYCYYNYSNQSQLSGFIASLRLENNNEISWSVNFMVDANEYFCDEDIAVELIVNSYERGTFKARAYTVGNGGGVLKEAVDYAFVSVV